MPETQVSFIIDNKNYDFTVPDSEHFSKGVDEILSNSDTDITFHQPWYEEGYTSVKFLNDEEYKKLYEGLNESIAQIISRELNADINEFALSRYHHFVTNDEDHFKVVSKTRDLFAEDFNFSIKQLIPRFENILGFGLTDINPATGKLMHIIVRINRPKSNDFNPPPKDIYEGVDNQNYIPQFVNLWIPIAGVTNKSVLPIAPKSHMIPESEILRTRQGGVVNGNTYRVRMIKEWAGQNTLIRPKVNYGEVLMFSSHLIHGLAVNDEVDITRVALEFRLFKKLE